MRCYLTEYEIENVITYLDAHQRTFIGWDVTRKKFPAELLAKFHKAMEICRKNGFIAPRVRDEKIVWSQVMGFKRNFQNSDQCCLCPESVTKGTCQGQSITDKNNQRIFVPCWIGGN